MSMPPRCEDEEAISYVGKNSGASVRKKLASAQKHATAYEDLMDQGEVVHWMSALNLDLVEYGKELTKRGYKTLDSIAFLVDEDIDNEIRPVLKVCPCVVGWNRMISLCQTQLLDAIQILRQDLFRM